MEGGEGKEKRNEVVGKGRREGREERNGREWWRVMGTGGEVGEKNNLISTLNWNVPMHNWLHALGW